MPPSTNNRLFLRVHGDGENYPPTLAADLFKGSIDIMVLFCCHCHEITHFATVRGNTVIAPLHRSRESHLVISGISNHCLTQYPSFNAKNSVKKKKASDYS
jgi:hypothetical protein